MGHTRRDLSSSNGVVREEGGETSELNQTRGVEPVGAGAGDPEPNSTPGPGPCHPTLRRRLFCPFSAFTRILSPRVVPFCHKRVPHVSKAFRKGELDEEKRRKQGEKRNERG